MLALADWPKEQSEQNDEVFKSIVGDAYAFDRKKAFTGSQKQPTADAAEKEIEKIKLSEAIIDDNDQVDDEDFYTYTKNNLISVSDDNMISLKSIAFSPEECIQYAQALIDTASALNTSESEEVTETLSEEYDDVETYISKDMENGNAFWIMGYTANAMKECGLSDEIGEMRERAMSSDYDNLCKVCDEYITRCNELANDFDDDYQVEGLEFVTEGIADLNKQQIEQLRNQYEGLTIRIIDMDGEPRYNGREGTVETVDGIGQLHGNWGGLAVIPGVDKFEVIG